ncbi:MAG TPA: VOC family protein [Gemmatimonadales bacterium]|jgi:methylmalonyl-CoA/ethylmalonyl-CoA epimerase|nr:VOC family protein [Gemmatimonadales bacterium]
MSSPVETASAPLLQKIGQIAVRATELPRAVRFYRDVLGLGYLFEAPGLAFFQCGGVQLMLSGAETPEFDHAASVLYFDVEEIQVAYRALVQRGVHFRDEPHVVHRAGELALWMAFFDDSEGNVFAIRCWRAA